MGIAPSGDVHGNQYTFSLIARDTDGYDRETFTIPVDMWGPNHDGWDITIENQTNSAFEWASMVSFNIFHAPTMIQRKSTATDIRGTQSWFGGPANLTLNYNEESYLDGEIVLRITSWDDGRVEATCTTFEVKECTAEQPVS